MARSPTSRSRRVRALVAVDPAGRVSTYGDIADCGRAFQPAHRRLDHAHRFVGPALASGDHRVRPAGTAPDHPAAGAAARRRRAGRATAGSAGATFATSSEPSTLARAPAAPARPCAPDPGTPRRSTADAARAPRAGTSTRATTSAAIPAAALQRSISPSSASPHDSASTTTTPAAHDAGRQYGVMSVMPGAAVPAKSTVP